MIGEHYECDGQMSISDVLGEHPEAIKPRECMHQFVLLRTKRAKYYKCMKCGKRCRYGKGMFALR